MKPKKPARRPRTPVTETSARVLNTSSRACVTSIENGAASTLTVRAQPAAKRPGFTGFWNGMPKIAVSAPPENGRANEEITHTIAAIFELRRAAVTLQSGATARQKKFRLACASDVVNRRLDELEARAQENESETESK